MKPLEILDCVPTPDGRELALYKQGDLFSIQIDRHDLMSSRAYASEEALSRLTVAELGGRKAPRLIIGGLDMGFTLRAALEAVGDDPDAEIVVAEVFGAVIAWNRGVLGSLAGHPLEDPRVRVEEGDIADVVAGERRAFDAILLDIDNGPQALTLDSNERIYRQRGLHRLGRALTPGGILAIWSAENDPRFADRLRHTGFDVVVHRVHARATSKGRRHVIFLARHQQGKRMAKAARSAAQGSKSLRKSP